jgi:hypothetical protein
MLLEAEASAPISPALPVRIVRLLTLLSATAMSYVITLAPAKKTPLLAPPAVGCATCWAAKYCAAFSALPSPQPPPNCPLVPRPKHPKVM